jgi:hypothetical protein
MDKSQVASAYAEVRADLSQLPGDLGKVPSIIKRMISTDSLKAVKDILSGNIAGGLSKLITNPLQGRAEQLNKTASSANTAKQAADVGKSIGGEVETASQLGIAAIGAVGAAATAYFASVVAAAKQASENLKTDQLVRATGEAAGWSTEQLKHMGEQLRKNSAYSASDVAGAQQALLKNPNIKGAEFDKALKTAADIAAVFGKQLPQAASELGEILAGLDDPMKVNGEMLKQYGVLLDDAQQGALKNAVATRDWAGAQEMVLGYLSKFDGAAKEAGETGAGGFDKLKNSILAAVVQIGGLNGDIGQLAGNVSKVIDEFMSMTIVKDLLDIGVETLRVVSGWELMSSVVDNAGKEWKEWGDQVSEIYHNVRDQTLELWNQFKASAKEALDLVLSAFGSSWDDIKATVTDSLDAISLLTTNFGLTAKYVWVGIELAAQQTWDAIQDGLAALQVSFEAAWKSIAAGAEAAWDQIEEAFGGPKAKSIGEAMSQAFNDGLKEGAAKYKFGDSDAAKKLKEELGDIVGQMDRARETVRARRAEDAAKKDAKDKGLETPGKGTPYVNTKPFKFEFTGFEELYKKIQTSLTPSESIQLQRAGVDAAEKAVANLDIANKRLGDIADSVKGGVGIGP